MQRFRFLLVLPLLFALLAYASETLDAARTAFSLWWESVAPALLPFLIGSGVLVRLIPAATGARAVLPVFLAGAVCGYPTGAKLLGDLARHGGLPARDAARAALVCNLPSPVFLLSIIACGMFQSKAFFLPLAVGCYLPPVLLLPFLHLKRTPAPAPLPRVSAAKAVTDAIGDGVVGIARIGGCIVTACVLFALLEQTGLVRLLTASGLPMADAVTAGALEMTIGCMTAATAAVSLRLRLTACAFFVSFGGLSVFLQTCCFLEMPRPFRYLLGKLAMGVCSAAIVYALFPLFSLPEPAAAVFAQGAYLRRAVTAGALVSSAGVSLLFVLLYAVVGRQKTPQRKTAA